MPFDIDVHASNLVHTGNLTALNYEHVSFRAELVLSGETNAGPWGTAAQDPAVGGSGFDNSIDDLSDLSAGPTKIFDGGRRTARTQGTLLEQAVSFNIYYGLSLTPDVPTNTFDFAMGTGTLSVDVTYSAYAP